MGNENRRKLLFLLVHSFIVFSRGPRGFSDYTYMYYVGAVDYKISSLSLMSSIVYRP